MVHPPRLSSQTIAVLAQFMARPRNELSGADIAKLAQLSSGTLYPILLRLEKIGWLESRWEVATPSELGRPRRRLYRITALGAKSITKVASDLAPLRTAFAQ